MAEPSLGRVSLLAMQATLQLLHGLKAASKRSILPLAVCHLFPLLLGAGNSSGLGSPCQLFLGALPYENHSVGSKHLAVADIVADFAVRAR